MCTCQNSFEMREFDLYNCMFIRFFYGQIQSNYSMTSLQKLNALTLSKQDQEYLNMKSLLSQGLFTVQSTLKNFTKKHLALLSTPGVAQVCLHTQVKPKEIDIHSIRGRSVAIVSRGKLFGGEGRLFFPIMDWFVAQIKYYSNIDCYPFIIRQECGLKNLFLDLSNSYAGVLFLDNQEIPEIITPVLNFFVLSHWRLNQFIKGQFTDAEKSSYVLAHLINNFFSGNLNTQKISQFLKLGKSRIRDKDISEELLDCQKIKNQDALSIHKKLQGKIGIFINFTNIEYLKNIFTFKNLNKLIQQKKTIECSSSKLNTIVTDGTAVLGLGNIGPIPALPVMQMKCMMFKQFGDVSVIPVCINPRSTIAQQIDAILDLVHLYKAINLQDIKAPQCFTIERTLQKMDILPVFHDDQHGTAIAAMAGFINAIKLAKKKPSQVKVVVNGAGAAGINIARILYNYGVKNIIVCDTSGTIYKGRQQNMNQYKKQIAQITNTSLLRGQLRDAINQADVFIGVSTKGAFKKEWIQLMNENPIIFAMANPDPEISREDAMQKGCFIYGSGKSNQPNQITNSLVYPGVFRAINQHKISKINKQMQIQIAEQIAFVKESEATREEILPNSLNKNISIRISQKLKQLKKQKQN